MASISRIPEARRFRRCPVDDKDRPTTTTIDDGDDGRTTTTTIDDDGWLIDDRRVGVAHRRVRAQSVRLSMGGARSRVGAMQRCPRRVPRGSRAGKPSEHGMLENEGRKFPYVGAARPPTLRRANLSTFRLADLPTCDSPTCRPADLQTCRLAYLPTCQPADPPTCQLADGDDGGDDHADDDGAGDGDSDYI